MKIIVPVLQFRFRILVGFLTLIFFQIEVLAQSRNFAFFYELEYSLDSTNTENKEKELMVLWETPNRSLFQSYNGYQRDSVYAIYFNRAKRNDELGEKVGSVDLTQMLQHIGQFPNAKNKYKVLKSADEDAVQQYRKLFKTDYVFSEPLHQLNWSFETGTKEILGYACQLATVSYSGRVFSAWFTSEIPFNNGPYIFGGLPGLILELYDADCEYNFKLVGMEKRGMNISEQLPVRSVNVTKTKYFKLEDEYRENPFSQMSEMDASRVSVTEVAEVQKRLKSRNIRLEKNIDK